MDSLKKTSSLISILVAAASAAALSACGGAMEADTGTGSGSLGSGSQSVNCDVALMNAFKPYHAVLKQQCNVCHVGGGPGNGAFADANLTTAFNVFKLKTESKVYSYAIDPNHKAPFSGTDNIPLLDSPKQTWNTAMAAYSECMGGTVNPPGPTPTPTPTDVSIFTQSKTITLVAGAAGTTLTWQLGSELVTANPDLAGAKLTALIEGNMGTTPYVVISNISITGGTGSSLYAKNAGVKLNDVLIGAPTGATFSTAERYIPKSAARMIARSGGAMIVPTASLTNLQIAIGFQKLEKSTLDGFPIDFDPPTFAQLNSATAPALKKIFVSRCTSCHNAGNAQGGIDLTNYNSLFGGAVVPFEPQNSAVYLAIENGSMPKASALPPAEKDSVRFWIMDGAPK